MCLLEEEPYALFCEEQTFVDDDFAIANGGTGTLLVEDGFKDSPLPREDEDELFCEIGEVEFLISKENETRLCYDGLISDGSLADARGEAVCWVLKVNAHYGFSSSTAVLAVNYFDRFLLSIGLQRNKPWTIQLAAVACLSLAAKFQETQVPLLLDFQVEESKYVFEAKTIQRMELLVLSTLQWRMNPVTPVAFFHGITSKSVLRWEFLLRCESRLLSLIADVRLSSYLPSVVAAAIMLYVVKEAEPLADVFRYNDHLSCVTEKTNEGKVNECYELIRETLDRRGIGVGWNPFDGHKRKILSIPSSPIGVVDASFSCDSSNDSWVTEASLLSSPDGDEYGSKRTKFQHH